MRARRPRRSPPLPRAATAAASRHRRREPPPPPQAATTTASRHRRREPPPPPRAATTTASRHCHRDPPLRLPPPPPPRAATAASCREPPAASRRRQLPLLPPLLLPRAASRQPPPPAACEVVLRSLGVCREPRHPTLTRSRAARSRSQSTLPRWISAGSRSSAGAMCDERAPSQPHCVRRSIRSIDRVFRTALYKLDMGADLRRVMSGVSPPHSHAFECVARPARADLARVPRGNVGRVAWAGADRDQRAASPHLQRRP